MTDDDKALQEVHGRVKWFDLVKGFGFIVSDDGGPDILLHANVLRNFGQSSVADGAGITVRVQQTQRGAQAVEVLAIEPPEGVGQPMLDDLSGNQMADPATQPLEPARVKWFDKGKGFGFANVFGRPEDVFIHVEVLRLSGFADLQPGEAIGLRIIEGKRGRMATQVTSWEAALREDKPE
ncbi:cold-shock protein [Acidimangrovimonas pyrenivorans]|uniref:Cold-shock protein n=1 Tax=Acidimangrovimonas pyrenivorans TaxID=2030798 RepID=A0ABV7AF58_9RHOB